MNIVMNTTNDFAAATFNGDPLTQVIRAFVGANATPQYEYPCEVTNDYPCEISISDYLSPAPVIAPNKVIYPSCYDLSPVAPIEVHCKPVVRNYFKLVERVIFSISDHETSHPVLTTIVYFKDGTRSVVKNAKTDKINLIRYEDGTFTADNNAKLTGVIYAVVKRMLGTVEDDNTVSPNGYMYQLQNIVDSGIDSNQQTARKLKAKRAAKERHLKMVEEHRRMKEAEKRDSHDDHEHECTCDCECEKETIKKHNTIDDICITAEELIKSVIREIIGKNAEKTSK